MRRLPILVALGLLACAPNIRSTKVGPNRYEIQTSQFGGSKASTMSAAHRRANELCPDGYETDDRDSSEDTEASTASTTMYIRCTTPAPTTAPAREE